MAGYPCISQHPLPYSYMHRPIAPLTILPTRGGRRDRISMNKHPQQFDLMNRPMFLINGYFFHRFERALCPVDHFAKDRVAPV